MAGARRAGGGGGGGFGLGLFRASAACVCVSVCWAAGGVLGWRLLLFSSKKQKRVDQSILNIIKKYSAKAAAQKV